jgi:hypothetical protein
LGNFYTIRSFVPSSARFQLKKATLLFCGSSQLQGQAY